MFDFVALEVAEVFNGRKSSNTAAKSYNGQGLRKQLGSGGGDKSASRVILKKSRKLYRLSRRDISMSTSH